ncbi:hydroxyneurosporene synthase [Fusarium beomiforme]|uniref:Hydroxyneurosporene synthase n=1 Tax=Fusarium beomiforme TaxID=44412 RepID=A0A9P5A5C9_9HYPO|nr:hydroxyneurosporene synthase [Fusarium beomiforme]
MKYFLVKILLPLLTLVVGDFTQCPAETTTLYPILYSGPSQVQFTSCASGADGPRVFPINATTFDWWYFDAVSDDGLHALTVIFFTSSFVGFSFDLESTIDPLNVYVFYNNGGDGFSFPIASTSVTIKLDGDGASGDWTGSGISFKGAPDLSTYSVTFEKTLLNPSVEGTFTLKSRGPGHYVCGPLEGGQPERVLPHVGWVNVMPAADAAVDVTIWGEKIKFTGNGYHDKNWGDAPFLTSLNGWYWGHATFGDYNIVFFDMLDTDNVEKAGGYVLKDGKVVGNTCTTGLRVRPVGTPYPPTLDSPNPKQMTLNMTLNDGTVLDALLTVKLTQIDIGLYTRWIGSIDGTVGDYRASGSALWEQFKVTSSSSS